MAEELHRLDDPLGYSALRALEADGLLIRLTSRCWADAAAPLVPELRAAALAPLPREGLVVSHTTAAWVWWGSSDGSAPLPLRHTTAVRRRVRTESPEWTVWESDVAPGLRRTLAGVDVTAPGRTLRDCLRDCVRAGDPIGEATAVLERTSAADVTALAEHLAAAVGAHGTKSVRSLAASALGSLGRGDDAEALSR